MKLPEKKTGMHQIKVIYQCQAGLRSAVNLIFSLPVDMGGV